MKVFCLLALFALTVSAAPFPEDESNHIHGENGWYVPQQDGSFVWMDKDDAESHLDQLENELNAENRLSTSPVTFYLYTNSNTKGTVITTKSAPGFNSAHPTRFIIHGWTQGVADPMNGQIRDAWFTRGQFNVIVVDWARARSIDYASSVVAVPGVGAKVGAMIDYLHNSHGMSLESLYVIGHSLGAHVAGYAGKNTKSGKVHTIIGLDPALPLFSYDKPAKRLNSGDGVYVESIQTNGGKLGFLKPIGAGAFYPNGGKSQPGCGIDATGSCSHGRSVLYYAEAVNKNDFPTMKCADYEDAVAKSCGSTYSSVRMGADTNAYMVDGDFYVPVRSSSPYGYGS